jgi:hypothetical protein
MRASSPPRAGQVAREALSSTVPLRIPVAALAISEDKDCFEQRPPGMTSPTPRDADHVTIPNVVGLTFALGRQVRIPPGVGCRPRRGVNCLILRPLWVRTSHQIRPGRTGDRASCRRTWAR